MVLSKTRISKAIINCGGIIILIEVMQELNDNILASVKSRAQHLSVTDDRQNCI